jgi:hypothetical protein
MATPISSAFAASSSLSNYFSFTWPHEEAGVAEFMACWSDEMKCTCIPFPQSISAVSVTMNYLSQWIAVLVGFLLTEVPLLQNL